jgi:hypothetical protein
MQRLATFDLNSRGLDLITAWSLSNPHCYFKIITVINDRWEDRYVVLADIADCDQLWLYLNTD